MGLKKSQLFYGQNFETPAKVRNAEIFEKNVEKRHAIRENTESSKKGKK